MCVCGSVAVLLEQHLQTKVGGEDGRKLCKMYQARLELKPKNERQTKILFENYCKAMVLLLFVH